MSEKNTDNICHICNKTFDSVQKVRRHQKRSKICKRITEFPPVNENPFQEVQKQLGGVFIVTKNNNKKFSK